MDSSHYSFQIIKDKLLNLIKDVRRCENALPMSPLREDEFDSKMKEVSSDIDRVAYKLHALTRKKRKSKQLVCMHKGMQMQGSTHKAHGLCQQCYSKWKYSK